MCRDPLGGVTNALSNLFSGYDGLPSPSQHSLNEGFGFSSHRAFPNL
jgi:hypothetical protein